MTHSFYDNPTHPYGTTDRFYDDAPPDYDPDRLHWRIEIAWNSTYVYSSEANGYTEAARTSDCYWNRGRQSFVSQDGAALTRMQPGRMVLMLNNRDGAYDPYNTSSPLYPNVEPGKFVRVGVRRADDRVYTWRFSGIVENIRPADNNKTLERFVEISCMDGWGYLQSTPVYLPVRQNVDVSTILPDLLYKVDWPYLWDSNVLADVQNLPFFWCGGDDARKCLFDIADTQDARLWIEGDGKLWYRNRTVAQTLIASITEADILRDIPIDMPWTNNWNYVKLISKSPSYNGTTYIIQSVGESVFNLNTEYVITSGSTIYIDGKYSMSNIEGDDILAAFGVRGFEFLFGTSYVTDDVLVTATKPTERPMIRYTFRSAASGGGTDVSGYVETVSFEDGGDGFRSQLKNTYTGSVYSTEIRVRVQSIFKTIGGDVFFASDQSNGKTRRVVTVETPYLISATPFTVAAIQDIADDYASHILTTSRLPVITFEARHDVQFMDILDRFNLVSAKKGINSDYRVGFVQEKWLSSNGQAIQTMIQTEPYYVA